MATTSDHYSTLGVTHEASAGEIKRAYRRLCRKYHPDLNPSPEATATMQAINEAYAVLSSATKRAEYDHWRKTQTTSTSPDGQDAQAHAEPDYCCEKCHAADASLRLTVFTWVVSLLVVSYRRGWAKILCVRCRVKYSLLFNLELLLLGWLGVPYGFLWSLEALWRNAWGGQQPKDGNAALLASLGRQFFRRGDFTAAAEAWTASLRFKADPEVEARLRSVAGLTVLRPDTPWFKRLLERRLHPAFYAMPVTVCLVGFWIMALSASVRTDNSPRQRLASGAVATGQTHANYSNHGLPPGFVLLDAVEIENGSSWYDSAEVAEKSGFEYQDSHEYDLAYAHFRQAAFRGRAQAQLALAEMFRSGQGRVANEEEAVKWYSRAVNRGYVPAYARLANLLLQPGKTSHKEANRAFWLCQRAGELGCPVAQWQLAQYWAHCAVPPDNDAALRWCERSANQGYPFGIAMMVDIHFATALRSTQLGWVDSKLHWVEFLKWKLVKKRFGITNGVNDLENPESWPDQQQLAQARRLADAFGPVKEHRWEWDPAVASRPPQAQGSGTGFFITEDGNLLTSAHVVDGARYVSVRLNGRELPLELVSYDLRDDIALLKAAGTFRPLPIYREDHTRLGASVFTIGFPNPELQGAAPKYNEGTVSGMAGVQDDARYYQISVPVQPGNSGGPLVDYRGNVVGMVEAQLSSAAALLASGALPQNVNYAVKSRRLSQFLKNRQPSLRLPVPSASEWRQREIVVQKVQEAVALVLAY